MLLRLIRPLRAVAQLLAAASTPRQLALGFTLGMLIGLVPKGNLIAAALTLALLVCRVNLATGMIGAAVFSWVGVLADPLTHRIGLAFLTQKSLQPAWAYLYDLPLAPWTAFNNTVVLGSLLLGLWLFYPTYRLSKAAFACCQSWLVERITRYRIGQLLWGAEMAARWRN